ncbi:MAG: hypothetical protein IPF68_12540 [Bacteroidales bacterium]|nr:hypothetical protein [Bacteroidales bacterium]
MDSKKVWQNIGGEEGMLENLMKEGNFSRIHSKHPLSKLRNTLRISIFLSAMITMVYILFIFLIPVWQITLALIILTLYNLFIVYDSRKLYKKLPDGVLPENSLKEELSFHYGAFMQWWHLQQRTSIFIYPVAAAGGFIWGGMMGSGKTVEAFLYNPAMLIILGIILLVLVPLSYWFARILFQQMYGRHLKKLKQLIESMES